MDKELKTLNRVYIGVATFITVAILAAANFVYPQSFFA